MATSEIRRLFDQFFTFNPTYQILICKNHEYAIRTNQISAHLDNYHQDILPSSRKELAVYIKSSYTDDIRYPTEKIPPIAYLSIKKDYLKCLYLIGDNNKPCGYITSSLKNIKRHLKDNHNWTNPKKRGRARRIDNSDRASSLWQNGIFCQQFYLIGSDHRLFEVASPDTVAPASELAEIGTKKLEIRLSELDPATRPDPAVISRLEPNPWLNRAGWARHLAGFDKDTIRSWTELPDSDDSDDLDQLDLEILTYTIRFLKHLIYKAQNIASSASYPQAALFYINRKETGQSTSEKPFNAKLEKATIDRYISYWIKIFIYLYKTWELPLSERPAYIVTVRLNKRFRKLKESIWTWVNK